MKINDTYFIDNIKKYETSEIFNNLNILNKQTYINNYIFILLTKIFIDNKFNLEDEYTSLYLIDIYNDILELLKNQKSFYLEIINKIDNPLIKDNDIILYKDI